MTENPILDDLAELQVNTPCTRSWFEAGLLLALCEKCPTFKPRVGCAVQGRTPALFTAFLCDAKRICPRWDRI